MPTPTLLGNHSQFASSRQAIFNPRELFGANEQGLWLDPSDMTAGKAAWRRNLLLNTEDLSLSPWTANGATFSANTTVAPDGTTTAGTFTGASGFYRIFQQRTSVVGASHTISLYVKEGTSPTVQIDYINVNNGPVFTFATESFSTVGGFTTNVQNVGNGWYRLSVTATNINSSPGPGFRASGATTFFIWGVQYEQSSTPTEYQKITDFSTEFKQAFPLHTLYQDSNGVTPCTDSGQPVGLILDQSRGGLGALGSEVISNGTFDSNINGWTTAFASPAEFVWSAGKVAVTNATTNIGLQNATASAFVIGKFYLVEFDLAITAGSVLAIRMGNATSGAQSWTGTFTGTKFRGVLNCIASGSIFLIQVATGSTLTIDNISVREVPGNHAYQTSSGARPTLARIPSSGRRNVLTYSEQWDNAAWVKSGSSVTANATTAPDGTITADKFVESNTNAVHFATLSLSASGGTYTFSCYAKASERNFLVLETQTAGVFAYFNLSNGTVGTTSGSPTTSITSVGNGWYRCSISASFTSITLVRVYVASADNVGSYLGDGTSGIFLWGAQLETGSTATNYQKVGSTFDVSESGTSDLWHLVFDGSDDSLVTNAVDFNTWTQETRRNLLLATEDFSGWANSFSGATVTPNTTADPIGGGNSADTISFGVSDYRYVMTNTGSSITGKTYTFSCWVASLTGKAKIVVGIVNSSTGSRETNLVTLTNTLTRVSVTKTFSDAGNLIDVGFDNRAIIGGDGIAGDIVVWGAQLEEAASMSSYQRVGTDEMTVIAGVRKLSDAALAMIMELSATQNANGAFFLAGPRDAGVANYSVSASATNGSFINLESRITTFTAPISNVLSIALNLGASTDAGFIAIRANGSAATQAFAGSRSSGNFGNHQLFIGRRNQASLPYNGHLYQLIIRGKTTPTGKLLEAEKFVSKKTGVNI